MDDGMAIWTHRTQILNWINHVIFAYLRERFQVMNMYDASTDFSILLGEAETADQATRPVMCNASPSCLWIALVEINCYPLRCTFLQSNGLWDLFGQGEIDKRNMLNQSAYQLLQSVC